MLFIIAAAVKFKIDPLQASPAKAHTLKTGENFDVELRMISEDGESWLEIKGPRVDDEVFRPQRTFCF